MENEPWMLDSFRVTIGSGQARIVTGIRLLRKDWQISEVELEQLKTVGTVLERRDRWDCLVKIEYLWTDDVGKLWSDKDSKEAPDDPTGPFMTVEKK